MFSTGYPAVLDPPRLKEQGAWSASVGGFYTSFRPTARDDRLEADVKKTMYKTGVGGV
jgi:hypothetical protein